MKYPKFFPYPFCFGQSIYLLTLNIPAIIALWIFSRFYKAYGLPMFFSSVENKAFALLTFFILAFALATVVFSYFDFVLFGNHKPEREKFKFIPSGESIIEGLIMTVFSGISYLIMALLIFPFYDFRYGRSQNNFIAISWIIWIIIAAYCFYLRELFRKDKIQS